MKRAHYPRLRGKILHLLYENQEGQRQRLDSLALHGVLDRLHFDISVNELHTLLQDLKDRGYVKYVQEKNKYTGMVSLNRIEITAAGHDLLEGFEKNKAVELE